MSDKYSYSKLDTYKQCPFKFYLNYVLGNYAYSSSIATEFGTAIHECEEKIAIALRDNKPIDYVSLKNEFILKNIHLQIKYPKDYWEDDGKSNRNYKDKMFEYLDKSIYNLEKFMQDHPSYKIVGIEQKFNFKFSEEHNFTGAIDRAFYDSETDTYLLQDIKSWAVEAKKEDLATPLQFVIYTLAAKELWKATKVRCEYYLPLVENGLKQSAGTNDFIERGLEKINKLFSNISQKDFTPNKTPLCNWCAYSRTNPEAKEEFKYLCAYHSLWERTSRNRAEITKSEYEWRGLEENNRIVEEYRKKFYSKG